ncbi:MAG: hypothetical protein DDT31_00032 [Syntrophomonadaceae bacterium]|nr:hypothetical protein [Bacillota bacterium]
MHRQSSDLSIDCTERATISPCDITQLVRDFAPAVLETGKINPAWRKRHSFTGELLLQYFEVTSISEAWFLAHHKRTFCETCGKKTNFSHKHHQYSRFCSASCGQRNANVQLKRESSNLERHGTKNAGGFGTLTHLDAMLQKYGVKHPMYNPDSKSKLAATNIAKYGVTNAFASEDIKEKIRGTNLDRHNVAHNMQREEVKQKFRDEHGNWKPAITNLGVRRTNRFSTITDQVKNRLRENGFDLLSNESSFNYKIKHLIKHQCGETFTQTLGFGRIPRCFACEPKLVGTSLIQKSIEDALSPYTTVQIGCRLLAGREIDIFLPKHNIGIEVNGLYWHSELAGKSKNYHQEKTELAEKLGIQLIHLYEDTIIEKFDVVVSMLLAKIGISERVFARKCKLEKVDPHEAAFFCEHNHLQGNTRCSSAIGLRYNEKLVAVATFGKPRYNKEYEQELLRFCTLKGHTVVGGFTKIIRHFMASGCTSLLSYADRSYSKGRVYQAAGFNLKHVRGPGYWYFRPNELHRHHRSQFQKHKLHTKLETFDATLSEWKNMQLNGWNRIWDSGQLVFVLTDLTTSNELTL